jgi:hypothetical protein
MVTLAGSQVWWTWETEDSFRRVREGDKHAMKTYASKLTDQLGQLTGMVSGLAHVVLAAHCCRAHVHACRCRCFSCWCMQSGFFLNDHAGHIAKQNMLPSYVMMYLLSARAAGAQGAHP